MTSTLSVLVEDKAVQFIFVGGKGGVGKTTTSSSLALQLARRGRKTLLISTDPAHNLGDAFDMTFSGDPAKIEVPGCDPSGALWALEVDPTSLAQSEMDAVAGSSGALAQDPMVAEFKEWLTQIPGVDEAMALASILDHVKSYDVIVFDTAPTGHTIRLLKLPAVLKAGMKKLESWKARLGGLLGNLSQLFGGGSGDGSAADKAGAMARLYERLKHYHARIEELAAMFRDNAATKFVCVCIAQYLSVYETARLMGELHAQHIACEHVVVNMLLPCNFAPLAGLAQLASDANGALVAQEVQSAVELCGARARIQKNYLSQLYDAVGARATIVRMPLLSSEVRGVPALIQFSGHLVERCDRLHDTTIVASRVTDAAKQQEPTSAVSHPLATLLESLLARPVNSDDDEASGDAVAAAAAAMAPLGDTELAASFAKLQQALFAPGGIQRVLATEAVRSYRADAAARGDVDLVRFFADVEGPAGLFGALPHLSNTAIIDALKEVAPIVLIELESASAAEEASDDGEDMYD